MQHSKDRILTTHVGSLPRPPDLLALLEARERGEAIDEAAYAARLADGGARDRRQAGRRRHRQRLRRRAEQDLVHLLCAASPVRHRRGAGRRAGAAAANGGASRHSRPPGFRRAAAGGARRHLVVRRRRGAALHRAGRLPRPRAARARPAEPRRRLRRGEAGRGVHERRLAGGADQVRARPLLQQRGRLRRSPGRRALGGIRGDPQGRLHPADRRARSRLGPAQPVPASVGGRVPAHRRAQHRGAQPRHPQHPARGDAHAHLLGQLRRAAHPRHRARQRCLPVAMRARPVGVSVRGGQPAARPRMGGSERRQNPGRQDHDAGLPRLDDQLRRAPAAHRAAHLQRRRDRRARAGRRRRRLRLCDLRGAAEHGRAVGGLGQAGGAGRRRPHRHRPAVGRGS